MICVPSTNRCHLSAFSGMTLKTIPFLVCEKKELTPREVEEAAENGKPFINYPYLHRQVWAKEYFLAQAKHTDTKFKGDYTQIPRGRVAWTIDKFIVLVGHWAEPIQDELTDLIEKAFSLPYFEFVYDEHWILDTVGQETCLPVGE